MPNSPVLTIVVKRSGSNASDIMQITDPDAIQIELGKRMLELSSRVMILEQANRELKTDFLTGCAGQRPFSQN